MEKVTVNKFLWLEYRIYQIDPKTRIELGWHYKELGRSYQLQRLERSLFGDSWVRKSFTYQSTHAQSSVDRIIEYLLWREGEQIEIDKPAF